MTSLFLQRYGFVTFIAASYFLGKWLEQNDEKTLFRNKSKLFGGRELPPGQELWK